MVKNKHMPSRLRLSPTIAAARERWLPNNPPTPTNAPISPRKALLAPQTKSSVPPARSQPCRAPTSAHRPMPNTGADEAMPRPRLALPSVLGCCGAGVDMGGPVERAECTTNLTDLSRLTSPRFRLHLAWSEWLHPRCARDVYPNPDGSFARAPLSRRRRAGFL